MSPPVALLYSNLNEILLASHHEMVDFMKKIPFVKRNVGKVLKNY